MATKGAKAPFGGAHTAGIYADMTVDGPEIGTLVVIVDRARNLPNRKTMGKQDPYCAARLGKEAKKTETDKRGGQTPRWDQEMRFIVHDSPDYYQLKVSVFNDDKKTELIGETWIALGQLVVPGGGQNDLWHNLNCKGRYAGEIRIELTYYDTRPKEEKVEERRLDPSINGVQDNIREAVGGPRQPKPVKRRPLPSNPTATISPRPTMPDHAQSSPQPYNGPPENQDIHDSPQLSVGPTTSHRVESAPVNSPYQYLEDNEPRGPLSTGNLYGQKYYDNDMGNPALGQSSSNQFEIYDPDRNRENQQGFGSGQPTNSQYEQQPGRPSSSGVPSYSPGYALTQEYQAMTLPTLPLYDKRYTRPFAQPLHNANGIPFSNSMPDVRPQQVLQDVSPRHHRSSINGNITCEESPTRHYSLESNHIQRQPSPLEAADDDSGPPPPPVHRSSGLSSPAQPSDRGQSEYYSPIPGPAPLRLRNDRGSVPASPLSKVQSNTPDARYPMSTSPLNSQTSHPSALDTSRNPHSQPGRRQSQNPISASPVREYAQSMPPSLVPGYEPSIAEDESERLSRESRMSAGQIYANEPVSQHQQWQDDFPQSRAPFPNSPVPSPLRPFDGTQDRRAHRPSASSVKPVAGCPDPRTPMRKSVSPQPGSVPVERRLSAIPFSPDSYDAFNPSASAGSSINSAGPKYNTPDQAQDAFRQHEVDVRLGDGPIIGSNGRVIDPSDHLPTETWAPEPEVKMPKKGPQVTMRFRQSPSGAQPMPPSARRPLHEATGRPHSVSTPIFAHSTDPNSPASANRNRLQKKSRISIAQATPLPNSSPIVPTLGANNGSPRNAMPRAPASDYPLREHENYGYGSSPTYARSSPGGGPPPIPGKIPIQAGQEDWGNNALSEEMRRIDIGVGGGQGRARRGRYGP